MSSGPYPPLASSILSPRSMELIFSSLDQANFRLCFPDEKKPYIFSIPIPVIMPSTGGSCMNACTRAERVTVNRNMHVTVTAPLRSLVLSVTGRGCPFPMVRDMRLAGTNQLTKEGSRSSTKSGMSSLCFCQTMSVVTSPKGLNAPPAFDATIVLMNPSTTKLGCPLPTVLMTAPIRRAVVRLSASGERKKAISPVTQNMVFRLYSFSTRNTLRYPKTLSSCMVLT
mmetsp:Transcript_7660/g.47284  ORF Transcript_7660/g.47284 Transcript_7660/m.47284 type:complete len:226 (-) Transcript_7660:824-1501(-)